LEIKLNAVCPKDELKTYELKSGLYIVNLENSNQGGSHWVALIIYSKNNQLHAFYCDSFGVLPPTEIEDFVRPLHKKLPYNNRQIQPFNSSYCGYYGLSLAYTLENSRTSNNIINDIHKWISCFSNDLPKNKLVLEHSFLPNIIKLKS
jgi:hypothetical protein